ncbi:MAG: multidrug efflux MFS transporter, partial [Planctomycetes bacterium]|nr:multidrug efflux MFS transporter [Planctomycetota bacterium]
MELNTPQTAWKRTFILAFCAQILGIMGFSFAMPFLPYFIGELGVADSGDQVYWAGILHGASGLTLALLAPVWGAMADRYGRKRMLCRAMFGGGVAVLLMSFCRTVPQLLACRIFQGAFSGTL